MLSGTLRGSTPENGAAPQPGRWIWGGILAMAAALGAAIPLYPRMVQLALLALFGVVAASVFTFRLSFRGMLYAFILSAFASSWLLPLANIGGLNLRPSQIALVLILLALWLRARVWDGWLRLGPYVALGLWLWTATLFFTLLNAAMGSLTSQSTSLLSPLGRVALLGINLAHAGVTYTLVKRSGALDDAIRWVVLSTMAMVLLTLTSMAAAGTAIGSLMGTALEEQPVLVGGEVRAAVIERLSYGVATGSISASVVVMVLGLLIGRERRDHVTLWGGMLLGMIGVVFGVARAAVVSLAFGGALIGLASWRRFFNFLWAGVAVALLVWGMLWAAERLVGSELVLPTAFLGRALLLLQPESYTVGTVGARLALWSAMVSDFLRNPLWGHGQDSFDRYLPPGTYGSHNFALEVLHTSGLWGFVPYFLIHLRAGRRAWRKIRVKGIADSERSMALAILAANGALWLAAATNLVFWSPAYWVMFGLLMAVGDLGGGADHAAGKAG